MTARSRCLVLTSVFAGAALVGLAVALGNQVILSVLVAALMLPAALLVRPSVWAIAIVAIAVAGRAVVVLLGLPPLLAFAHYPASFAFLAAATVHQAQAGRPVFVPALRWLGTLCVLAVLGFVIAPTEPARTLVFLAIFGEPLAIIAALQMSPHSDGDARRVVVTLGPLVALQIPIGLWQGLTKGWGDPVVGTFLGHGAGAHVLGALFALTAFIALAAAKARKIPWLLASAVTVVAFGMMAAADAKQVTFAAATALAVGGVLDRQAGSTKRRGWRVGAVVVAIGALVAMGRFAPGTNQRAVGLLKPKQLQLVDEAQHRMRSGTLTFVFGSGPGAGASRASILLTSQEMKDSSPLSLLGLGPTPAAIDYVSRTLAPTLGGSAEAFTSSAMSLLVDLGIVGVAAWLVLFFVVWRRLGRSPSWLAGAARLAVVMTGLLASISVWLEYPEFTVPLAVLIGLALPAASTGRHSAALAPTSEPVLTS
jgi:hypothetical protein